jgi:hypothetical protein
MSPATQPPPRDESAMTYDAAHDSVILYGGLSPNASNDTWQYAPGPNTWTRLNPPATPGTLAGHSMVYDSINRKIVLFGGYSVYAGPGLNAIWLYDAGSQTWTNPNPSSPPPGAYYPAMAFDSKRGLVVLYEAPGNMWAYNVATNQWGQLPVNGGPAPTDVAGGSCPQCLTMAYDAGTDKFILTSQDPSFFTATWELSLGSTVPVAPPPTQSGPSNLVMISGNAQTGNSGAALNPFIVAVTDPRGNAVSGAGVVFAITSGGGTLSSAQATTDTSGRAETTLTLGAAAGTTTVTATSAGLSGSPVTFSATAMAPGSPQPAKLTVVSGNNQTGAAGQPLANPLVVLLTDDSGAPITGRTVAFSVTAGGGSVSVTQASTDAQGQASCILTLGAAAGSNTVAAGFGSLSPAVFTATATKTATWLKSTITSSTPYFRGYNRVVYDVTGKRALTMASDNANTSYGNSFWGYDTASHAWTQKTTTGSPDQCIAPLGSNPAAHPANRNTSHNLTYDTTRGAMYLFSGSCQGYTFDDTWAYNSAANTWSQLSPAVHPPGRTEAAIAYDSAHDVVVLYGGLSMSALQDTWQYAPSTNTWTQISAPGTPGPLAGHSMVYDTVNKKIVLFGGYAAYNGPALNAIWIYDAGTRTWTNPQPANPPAGAYYPAMAFDSARGVVVLYGGPALMWTYNVATNAWTQATVSGGPAITTAAGAACPQCITMTYDSGADKFVLTSQDPSYYLAAWELSAGDLAASPFDLNGDGSVNIIDLQLAIRQITGVDPCGTADVDRNGTCNAADLQLIINKVVGK